MSTNTYHVLPTDPLAPQAASELRGLDPGLLVAVRGQVFDGQGALYTVSPCPDQGDTSKYEWTYVMARDWLAEFDSAWSA